MTNPRSRPDRSSAPTVRNRRGKEGVKVTESMNAEFDGLLARMQTPKGRAGMKTAFGASPKRLGKASLAANQKRRKPRRRVKLPLVP